MNRSPVSAVDHNVPEELWLNKKPGYKHLRRFGSVAYVHQDQGKLKPRALKGVFLGYPQGTKGYKVWLIEERKCVVSRNVIFHEEKVYKDLKPVENHQESSETVGNGKVVTEFEAVGSRIAESSNAGGAFEDVSDSESEGSYAQTDSGDVVNEPASYQLARDRPRRALKPPAKLSDYTQFVIALLTGEDLDSEEPRCYHEATKSKDWHKWNLGMGDEMTSLWKNLTWDIVDRPTDKTVISCMWLYKKKPGIPGVEPERYKARLVAIGFTQKKRIDYDEVFAPVVKHISIRILMSVVAQNDLELEQMDVKTAFLHGELDQPLYMEQPEGYVMDESKDQVCLLKKSLYGLK